MKKISQVIKAAYSTQDPHQYIDSNGLKEHTEHIHDIAYYRNRIFNLLTLCLIPTGLIALVPGVLMAIKSGTSLGYLVAAGDVVIAGSLIYIIVSKRINAPVKKAIVVGTLYLLAVFLMISLGSFGPGIIYVALVTVLMSLIFTSKIARLSIWLNLTICVFLGVIIQFELFNSQLSKLYNLGDWIAYSTNLMVFTVISFLLISNLIKSLEGKIRNLLISEARQHGLLASQTSYVIRTDMSGNYTYVNQTFMRDFGWLYDDRKIIGQNALNSISDYHHQRLFEIVAKCKEHPNQVFQVTLDKPKETGGVVTTLWECISMTDELGAPSEIQCVGIDISEHIRAEHELKLSLEDLYKHNKELQTYAYVISHDLRAPVANILGLVSLIEIDHQDEQVMNAYVNGLKQSATNLDQVIKDLSKGVSIADHAIESSKEEVNLQDTFISITNDLTSLIVSANAELELPSDPFSIYSHKEYLYLIFHNLIYNAIKYKSERRPQIKVGISANAQYVTVTIADNGIGIDLDKHYDDLFKPYKRLSKTIKGKGLGLFFVKRHVDALGGVILVESQLGIGSSFIVVLPKYEL